MIMPPAELGYLIGLQRRIRELEAEIRNRPHEDTETERATLMILAREADRLRRIARG